MYTCDMHLGKINKNVRIFYLANSFYYGSFDIINTFLAVLITNKITDGRVDAIGLVVGYYMFLRAIIEVPFTKVTNKWSQRTKIRFITISALIYGALIASMGFAGSLWVVFAIQTFLAIIDAITYPMKWAIFSNIIDKGNEEMEWSIEDTLSVVTTATFAVVGGILAQKYGLELLFIIMGMMFALSGLSFHYMRIRHNKFMKD